MRDLSRDIRRNREAERLCRLQVDRQGMRCWLSDWQIGGICAVEDLVYERCTLAEQLNLIGAIRHEGTALHVNGTEGDRR